MTRSLCAYTWMALTLAGCGDSGGGTASASTSSTSVTTATPGSSSSGGGSGSGGSEGTSSAGTMGGSEGQTTAPTTGGLKLDVGVPGTTTDSGGGEQGCRKVDFLFVIDNSGSMSDEQDSLISSFPGFISSIQSTLKEAQDYHIMVVDSDAWLFAGCDVICPLFLNTCPPAGLDFMCGTPPLECEDVLGAGVVHPRGLQSSQQDCMFSSGGRYMDISEPDLAATFACAAKVGTGSTLDPEKPMEAMVQAIAPKGPAFDCNLGFIRPDAILVVTFITDEDDNVGDGSSGTPAGWKAALVAAKKGDETALVVLGLFGDNDQPNAICPPLNDMTGAEPSPRLREFVESFGPRGFSGSICAGSYDEFFAEAVGIIDTTCDGFIPPPM